MESKTEQTFRQKVDNLLVMFKPDFDWDTYDGDESLDELFRECVRVGEPDGDESKKYYECGSINVEDTPSALYRLLYICRPKSIDFSTMYKIHLFSFFSVDKRFLVSVELFKYEIGLYFCCPREALSGKGSFVVGGWPGCDNNWSCSDEDGKAFFEMVKQAVSYEWEVYPGNHFVV